MGKHGRPTKYLKEYDEKLIEHMDGGLSYESFAGAIGVSKQTIYDWEKKHKTFLDAKSLGRAKSQLFWEKKGIDGLFTNDKISFNASTWIFNMKNRFLWRDKPEEKEEINKGKTITLNYNFKNKDDE